MCCKISKYCAWFLCLVSTIKWRGGLPSSAVVPQIYALHGSLLDLVTWSLVQAFLGKVAGEAPAWVVTGPFFKIFFLALAFLASFLAAGLFIFATMPNWFFRLAFSPALLAAATAASLPSLLLRKEGSAISLARVFPFGKEFISGISFDKELLECFSSAWKLLTPFAKGLGLAFSEGVPKHLGIPMESRETSEISFFSFLAGLPLASASLSARVNLLFPFPFWQGVSRLLNFRLSVHEFKNLLDGQKLHSS